jgi:hypothetical protein
MSVLVAGMRTFNLQLGFVVRTKECFILAGIAKETAFVSTIDLGSPVKIVELRRSVIRESKKEMSIYISDPLQQCQRTVHNHSKR